MKEEKRVALDGHLYAAQEFQDFYGERSWQFYWDSAEREHSVDKPVAHSVDKPVGPEPASECLTTDSGELKNTSSVDKPATADEDLPPPSPPPAGIRAATSATSDTGVVKPGRTSATSQGYDDGSTVAHQAQR